MLFIALIIAACLYVGLYLLWQASQSHLAGPTNILLLLNSMFVTPGPQIFFLLRWLIFITFLYVVADFLYSSAKGVQKNQAKKAEKKAKADKRDRAGQAN